MSATLEVKAQRRMVQVVLKECNNLVHSYAYAKEPSVLYNLHIFRVHFAKEKEGAGCIACIDPRGKQQEVKNSFFARTIHKIWFNDLFFKVLCELPTKLHRAYSVWIMLHEMTHAYLRRVHCYKMPCCNTRSCNAHCHYFQQQFDHICMYARSQQLFDNAEYQAIVEGTFTKAENVVGSTLFAKTVEQIQ